MKNILLALLLIASFAQAEIRKSYYENGHIKHIRQYKDGKLNGISNTFYPTGEVKISAEFYKGILWGTTYGYYKNTRLKAEIPFRNGKVHGLQKEYFPNGQLRVAQHFNMGVPVGNKRVYFWDGNMKARINFNDKGQMEGTAKEYYASGMQKQAITFRSGKVISGWKYSKSGMRKRMSTSDFKKMGLKLLNE